MTQAIGARRDGDDFQARLFWLKAAVLLEKDGHIQRVGFESGPKGFDDVWVEYDPRSLPLDPYGHPLHVERLQCKWHVGPGQYTHIDLTRPEYISATKTSLLQRAHAAAASDRAAGVRSMVKLVTNHRVDPNDALHSLIRNRSHSLNVDGLFAGKTARSASGAVRKLWCEHLGIDDDELRILSGALGFSQVLDSLDGLRDQLDVNFKAYGLRRIPVSSSTFAYDDIIRQWAAQGQLVFDRNSFRERCKREKLLEGSASPSVVFGVKSFEHAFDRLEDRCVKVIDLIPEFDDRFIRDAGAWRGTLFPAIEAFLTEAVRTSASPRLRLAIDAHTTLAFAAGSVLNVKSGRIVEIEQRTGKRVVWAPDDRPFDDAWPKWEVSAPDATGVGSDIAVGISLTHEVEPKMRQYLAANPGSVGRVIVARPDVGPSLHSVLCGAHANRLAEELARQIKSLRDGTSGPVPVRMHLFTAAPNGFTFYLGRHLDSLQPLTLYEFDFQSRRDSSYQPSLSVPEADSPDTATK